MFVDSGRAVLHDRIDAARREFRAVNEERRPRAGRRSNVSSGSNRRWGRRLLLASTVPTATVEPTPARATPTTGATSTPTDPTLRAVGDELAVRGTLIGRKHLLDPAIRLLTNRIHLLARRVHLGAPLRHLRRVGTHTLGTCGRVGPRTLAANTGRVRPWTARTATTTKGTAGSTFGAQRGHLGVLVHQDRANRGLLVGGKAQSLGEHAESAFDSQRVTAGATAATLTAGAALLRPALGALRLGTTLLRFDLRREGEGSDEDGSRKHAWKGSSDSAAVHCLFLVGGS